MSQRNNEFFRYGNNSNNINGLVGDARAYLSKFASARQLGHEKVTMGELRELGYILQGIDTRCQNFRLLIDERYLAVAEKRKVGGETIVFYSITSKGLEALGHSNETMDESRGQRQKRVKSSRHFNTCSRNGFKAKHL